MENQVENDQKQNLDKPGTAPVPKKYGIFLSLQEMLGAAQRNPLTFTVVLLVSYVLSAIVVMLTSYAMASLLLGQFGLLFASLGRIITVLVVGLVVYTLIYAVVYAFTTSSAALSLSPERNRIGTLLKRALAVTPRIIKVNALVAVIAFWPLAMVLFLELILLSNLRFNNTSIAFLSAPILVLGAGIWVLIAHLRFALAPHVALFEPDVPVRQTLKRSQALLKKGGQWFIFKGFLLLLAVFILLGIATKSSLRELDKTDNWTINIIFIVLSILIEGALTMLYLNRAGKQNPANTPKSPRLLVLVIVILLGLFGFAVWQGQSNKLGGSLSKTDQQALTKLANDFERESDIRLLADALENFYDEHGYYPAASNMGDPHWTFSSLKYTSGSSTLQIQDMSLRDPGGKHINSAGSDYSYTASPENCTQCASFELIAKLEEGGDYKKSSLNNTIKPTSASTPQAQPVATNKPTTKQPPAATAKTDTAYVLYQVAADGNTAKVTPVTSTFTGPTNIELTIDLQCLGTCKFKLVSDNYTFSNTSTYTSSQKVKYQITKPGEYIFYNQFTPGTKFKIKF